LVQNIFLTDQRASCIYIEPIGSVSYADRDSPSIVATMQAR
jgi:hypothetical protein